MRRNKFQRIFYLVSLAIFFIVSVCSYSQIYNDNVYKFSRVLGLINMYYVDTVNQNKLIEEAIIGMLESLDPHSIYISKEEVQDMEEPLEGSFEGVGIQFNILHDTIVVITTIAGGPSEKVGILAGDRIVDINDENVAGVKIKNNDVLKKLRGEKGTRVNVKISRKGIKDLLDFTITRDKIPIFSIDAVYMADDSIGYIKIQRFAKTTMDEFHTGINKLKAQNMKHLILDLRDNAGGYMNVATELADEFLESSRLIVYTEGVKSPRKDYNSTGAGNFEKGKLVILVDGNSASASEIVAGAVQDQDRGIIIGQRTFGKGLVQRPFELNDGSKIRLTIARYYTPSGRSIQKPYNMGIKEYSNELAKRFERGELTSEDSIHFPDSLIYYTLHNKRFVYGGGGITPDIFIPLDTSANSDYYFALLRKGVINRFILDYIDSERKKILKDYPDFKKFYNEFEITDKIIAELVQTGEKDGVKLNDEQLKISLEAIKTQLKSLIARDLWTTSESYQVFNGTNPGFKKAVEVLHNNALYNSKLLVHNEKKGEETK